MQHYMQLGDGAMKINSYQSVSQQVHFTYCTAATSVGKSLKVSMLFRPLIRVNSVRELGFCNLVVLLL